jgi:GT2 family glycosyltransferase
MTEGQGPKSLAFFLRAWRKRRRPEAVIDRQYPAWVARHGAPDTAQWRTRLAATPHAPGISIIMPVFETRPAWLQAAIDSVRAQLHPKWELLIADDASTSPQVAAILDREAAQDPRIDVVRLPNRAGISAASNVALSRAALDYVTFLDHDDLLAPHATAAIACELATYPETDLIFSDEDQLINDRRRRPYFKPGWNPDLLLSQNLVCHLAVYRRTLVTRLGGLRPAFDGSQDFDLALRAVSESGERRIRHIPDVLYHWRQSPGSFSATDAAACRDATSRALSEALGPPHQVRADPTLAQWPDIHFGLPDPPPTVAIIGAPPPPTTYDAALIQHVTRPEDATADILLFLWPTLRPVTEDWLQRLLAHAARPDIGAAGPRLDSPDGHLANAGYVLDPHAVAHAPAPRADAADPGYRGHFHLARSVAALSSDCLAIRRAVFVQAGGFEASAGDFASVDLCLKLAARGLRSVWVPQARLAYTHMPKPPRAGAAWMRARWAKALANDPYHNPNLRLKGGRVLVAKGRKEARPGLCPGPAGG